MLLFFVVLLFSFGRVVYSGRLNFFLIRLLLWMCWLSR